MSGKFPNDRVRDATDAPETYDQNRERFRQAEAELRRTEDPISGARPETERVAPEADEQTDEQAAEDRKNA